MTAVLIAIVSLLVLGIPATFALDRRARGPLLLGASFLYGSGVIFLILLGWSTVGLRWSLVGITIAALVIWSSIWFLTSKSPRPATADQIGRASCRERV